MNDPFEIDFPKLNLVEMEDLETGSTKIVDTSNSKVRQHFKEQAEARINQTRRLMQNIGAGFIDIRTDLPYMPPIQKFFQFRSKRGR